MEEAIFLSNKIIVMNTKPGRIVAEFQVDLPEPRDRAGSDFALIRRKVFEAMHDNAAVKKPLVEYAI
ncbi:hypothetical protein FACS1894103_6700 [Campylobacterota bacterium]|nr:hypothetical protein FACS1894103_6700 [Campylobacterota bacterium]